MKAIIHIGTEKTGTSTIQEFLYQNRTKLINHGLFYLQTPGMRHSRKLATYCMTNDHVDDHVINLGIISEDERDVWKTSFSQEFVQEIELLDKNISTALLSSEHFHSRLITMDEVRTLHALLNPYFDEIKILLYLRRQDQIAISLYSTWCRVGGTHTTILDKTVTPDNPYYNYYDLVTKWASVFGETNLTIRVFDKEEFVNGDLLQDFAHNIGLTGIYDWNIVPVENKQLSFEVQNALVLFNKSFPYYMDGYPNHFNNQLRAHIIKGLEQKYTGGGNLPTKQEALQFYRIFTKSNKKLAVEYLSRENIFSEDFSMYPNQINRELLIREELLDDIFNLISGFMQIHITPNFPPGLTDLRLRSRQLDEIYGSRWWRAWQCLKRIIRLDFSPLPPFHPFLFPDEKNKLSK